MPNIAISTTLLDTPNSFLEILPKVFEGPLKQYLWIQENFKTCSMEPGSEFRRNFNHYYRVRQKSATWYDGFYRTFEDMRRIAISELPDYGEFLVLLGQRLPRTKAGELRMEASFASKLLATIDINRPVLDSIVMERLQIKWPVPSGLNRHARITQRFDELEIKLKEHFDHPNWPQVRSMFDSELNKLAISPKKISDIKVLDFLYWRS